MLVLLFFPKEKEKEKEEGYINLGNASFDVRYRYVCEGPIFCTHLHEIKRYSDVQRGNAREMMQIH
jgi:hypothetical protein